MSCRYFGLFFVVVFIHLSSRSQTPYFQAHNSIAEKIYLQTDSKVYTSDKIVWFKAVLADAYNHVPLNMSGVLYVELIGPDETILEKKIIKIEKCVGDGFFQLNPFYAEGLYQIRAYTEWNRNFGTDFIFKEYIRIFHPNTTLKADPIGAVALVDEAGNRRHVNVSFEPTMIDSLHKKDLTLVVSFDDLERRDTLAIKRNSKNKYPFHYAVPDKCQFVTLQIQTENHFSYSKTIVLDKNFVDLQFFPESGELVDGISGVVGFKALDCNGKGVKLEGEIVNENGESITFFKSNQLGMGTFLLDSVSRNRKYFGRVLPPSEENPVKMYPLPGIAEKGDVLSVKRKKAGVQVKATSNYLKNDSINLQITCRGVVYHEIKGVLQDGSLEFYLPMGRFPDGILAFTLKDYLMNPLAERLYFNEKPESRLNIAVSTDKESYEQRDLTELNIVASDYTGTSVKSNLSVLVLNNNQMGQMQTERQNILSYFLLSSDLKGDIEDPGYYFREGTSYEDLDALLLTQGWRKYIYISPLREFISERETSLGVSGTVSGFLFNQKAKKADLTMMTFGHEQTIHTITTDSLGRFNFHLNDEYGQNLNILIQSTNKSGVKKDYTIVLDKKESPPVTFNHILTVEKVDSIVHALIEKNIERKKVEEAFPLSSGDIILDEVVVEGYRMTPERKKVAEEYGKPDRVIDGKEILAKEEKWSYGLYSVLLFNFPEIIVKRGRDGNLYARVRHDEMTLVVIDGIPVKYYDYPFIANIPPSEVISFEVIKYAKNFLDLFLETFPQASPLDAPVTGDVIAIYTYGRKGIYGATRTVGILKETIPVFSASREFYVPKYDNLKPEDWFKPDLRALIHWEPRLETDSQGKATTKFYNADNTGNMLVVIEAISEKGEIGYKEFTYKVSKKEF